MSSVRTAFHHFIPAVIATMLPLLAASAAQLPPIVGPTITIGQQGVATAEPLVPVPPTTPCVVKLYTADSPTGTFNDYSNHPFSYTPPSACAGPWFKVVFKADFNVTAGIQYDRTATLWIGGVEFYFGTTQEPSPEVSPSWHVERDVTNLSAALKSAQSGSVAVYNIVNDSYTGVITGSAELDFYPVTPNSPAPAVANTVLSLGSDPVGNYDYINTDGTPLSKTLTLPTNITQAYLDVVTEPQSGDEFWYTCGPEPYISLTGCGGTGFREAEIAIDGQPAGIAPISPWVYTGGIDPYAWSPVPGVQTLNFEPFTINLTPFAGLLNDGQPHTFAISVVTGDPGFQNNSQYFATTANLRLFQDQGSAQVTGGLIGPVSDSGVHPGSQYSNMGSKYVMNAASTHDFTARGYVNTSQGKITTTVAEDARFNNHDVVINSNTEFAQSVSLHSNTTATTTTSTRQGTTTSTTQQSFPMQLSYKYVVNPDGSASQVTTVDQHLQGTNIPVAIGVAKYLDYHGNETDTLNFDAQGNFTGNSGQQATQSYVFKSLRCYSREVDAAAGAVTGVTDGAECQ